MPLIIEDGTLITNADSFVTRADYILYAAAVGVTISDTDTADVQLRQAVSFICSHELNIKGSKVSRDQSLCFPRVDVILEGFEWGNTEIPRQVILCQMAYALEINADADIYNPAINQVAKIEEVSGAVMVEYFGEGKNIKLSKDSRALALLNILLENNGLISIKMERS